MINFLKQYLEYIIIFIIITMFVLFLITPRDIQSDYSNEDYYKAQMLDFCELSLEENKVIRLLSNFSEINKIYEMIYEDLSPCEQWLLEE